MGNEASQEGEETAVSQQPQRSTPHLVTQQSMPLPVPGPESPTPSMSRRGSAGPQLMTRRSSSAGAGVKRGSVVELPEEVDLSNLSEEEKAKILSVMARAQSLEEELPPVSDREEEQPRQEVQKEQERCSLCHTAIRECACVECGALICRKCSKAIPSGKKHVWMCIRCAERYPQLSANSPASDSNISRDGVPVDRKRRTSEIAMQPVDPRMAGQTPTPRGRSDSLPSQRPRMPVQQRQPQQGPQMRQEHQQPRQQYPADDSQIRQQSSSPRAQHPQSQTLPRPRHPGDHQRPQHPNEQKVPPHPNEQLRPQRPMQQPRDPSKEQQKHPYSPEQQRLQQQAEYQRSQHPVDHRKTQHLTEEQRSQMSPEQQRQHNLEQQKALQEAVRSQYPLEQQKQQNQLETQRPQRSSEQQRPLRPTEQPNAQSMDQQRNQHPMEQQWSQHPIQQQRPQHPAEQQQRLPHPAEQQRAQHPSEQQRSQYPKEQQRPQYPIQQQRPQYPGEQQRSQHHGDQQRSQQTMDSQRSQYPVDQQKPQHPVDQQRPQHPVDQQRSQHPADQQKPEQTMDQIRAQHPMEYPRPQHPPEQQRIQHHTDVRPQYAPDQHRSMQIIDSSKSKYNAEQQRLPHVKDIQKQMHPNEKDRAQTYSDQQQSQIIGDEAMQRSQREPQNRIDHSVNQMQHPLQTSQRAEDPNSHHIVQYPTDNSFDYSKTKTYHVNEIPKPRPQHPIVNPPQKPGLAADLSPPEQHSLEYVQQRAIVSQDIHQTLPPQRNQRLRQPPEQQIIPRPQHPQQPPEEIPRNSQTNVQNNRIDDSKHEELYLQDKPSHIQQYLDDKLPPSKSQHAQQTNNSKLTNGQIYSPENFGVQHSKEILQFPAGKAPCIEDPKRNQQEKFRRLEGKQQEPTNVPEPYPHDKVSQHPQRQHKTQCRPGKGPIQNEIVEQQKLEQKHSLMDERNGVYVSLMEQKIPQENIPISTNQEKQRQHAQSMARNEFSSPSPPATLPRTKPPEVPQPAIRPVRRERPSGNQTLPRTGTNPFRSETNPFRRESLPQDLVDAGEYVTVAPRRGSLDERLRLAGDPNQFMKTSEAGAIRAIERGLERQSSLEKKKNSAAADIGQQEYPNSNRHSDEEQRRNAINSGACPPEPTARRQLPHVDHTKRPPGNSCPEQEQGTPPPIPKARTSLTEIPTYVESRNGIPRTVPLTSLAQTLQQQNDHSVNLYKGSDVSEDSREKEKSFINDLSQMNQSGGSQGQMKLDQRKKREDLIQPNIVDNSMTAATEASKMNTDIDPKPRTAPAQLRQQAEKSRDQANAESLEQSHVWNDGKVDQRKSKPLPPEDNIQDLEGYQDEEEEQNIDDYFEMIEKAITRPQPQTIVGGKKSSDIQRQLLNKENEKEHSKSSGSNHGLQRGQVSAALRQIDAYNQNQAYHQMSSSKPYGNVYGQRSAQENVKEKNDFNMYEQDKILASKKDFYEMDEDHYPTREKDTQYIIQPTEQRYALQAVQEDYGKQKRDYGGKTYDKLLLHELTPDTRQPSAKHYLEEHKTQPVSYEAFSSAKAMQQTQPDPRQQYAMQMQMNYSQHAAEGDSRNSASYYCSQQNSANYYQGSGQTNDGYDSGDSGKGVNSTSAAKPTAIDLQNQKKTKPKPDPQDWSPVSDLSPIPDVSPSIEAAEQELMEKFQEKHVIEDEDEDLLDDDDSRLLKAGSIPRATSGTISGMLEEFNRALGLPGTSPLDDSGIKSTVSPTSVAMSPITATSGGVTSISNLQKDYQESFGSPQKVAPTSSPQKTPAQPTTPRRSHRRLPQPTVEQMQAAVAMAAQGPREKTTEAPTTVGALLFGVDPGQAPSGRPTSPSMMPWKSPDMSQSFEQAYKVQSGNHLVTDTQGTVPSPAPRMQPRTSNNGSKTTETGQTVTGSPDVSSSQVRKLRSSSCSGSISPKPSDDLVARLNGGISSPHNSSVSSDVVATTVSSPQTPSTPRDKQAGDSSDTQSEAESIKSVRLRRKLPNLPQDQVSSPSPTRKTQERNKNGVSESHDLSTDIEMPSPAVAMTVTTTVVTTIESSRQYSPAHTLGAPSPTPGGDNLSPLLGRRAEMSRTPSPGGEASGTKLPQYMQNLKQQLRDELKAVTEERKVMLEQRGKERGEGESVHTRLTPTSTQPQTNERREETRLAITCQASSPHKTQIADQQGQLRNDSLYQQMQSPAHSPYQTQPKSSASQLQTYILSPYRTQPQIQSPYQSQEQLHQYPHTSYQAQSYAQHVSQEQALYSGRNTPQPTGVRTSLPDAVPSYALTHRSSDDDITIMTTATTTVVSASEQWHDGKRHRVPPTTTVAPSSALVGTSIESLRRLQSKMATQPSPKKGRRRHTSEITVPPFPQMESHEMAHTLHHPPMRQQPSQYIQYYTQVQAQQAGYRTMEFKSVDSHVRAADILRASGHRYGGSLGSGLGSTEALYQGRRVLNNKIQDYLADNRIMEQQQRLVGPDAYFQTLNNEINRLRSFKMLQLLKSPGISTRARMFILRRSSENLHRESIYDKPSWSGQLVPAQGPTTDTRTSPQTTERRKRKEKKSRKPRSWHPSPYVSEDEDDQLTREEKKAKIKAEIARRRQQIEENMRLHDELCKLAERRDRMEAGRGSIVPSPTSSVSYRTSEQTLVAPTRSSDGDDTSSVLKAIDEILRKDLYSGPLSRSSWASYSNLDPRTSYQGSYVTSRNRMEYSDVRAGDSWYGEEQQANSEYFQESAAPDPETAMDESIARIASTFPTDEPPDILLSATPGHFSPETEVTPAMPLLPDMPTRSRKLLENLGSSPIQANRSGSAQSLYQDHHQTEEDNNEDDSLGHRMQEPSSLLRSQRKTTRTPISKTTQKYDFPVKRILLTRDPKDRSVSGNGLGMKVVGGKEVPGSNGMIGAYVAKIFPGGVVETLGEVKEGDQVLEWNGVPLTGRTYEEVQRIIASSADEVEIVIRCDLNMLETMNRQRRSSPGMGTSGGPRGGGLEPPDTPGSGGGLGRDSSPAHSPYSPAGSRGQSPALTKRGMGGGGGGFGGNMVGGMVQNTLITSQASSYENLQSPDSRRMDFGNPYRRGGFLNGVSSSRSIVSVFAPGGLNSEWPDLYDPAFYPSPHSPDDWMDEGLQSRWRQENNNVEEMQFQVCCGPRTAIVYVPIIPVRPMVKSSTPAILSRNHFARRSVDQLDEYQPLLKNGLRTDERALGFCDLLRSRSSLGKVSLYLNSIKEKAELYDLQKKNGVCRVTEEEPRERPRAPSDLPGLRPVFVNDWKRPKKAKNEENDDNNNSKSNSNQNGGVEKQRKMHVGSSPEATPYNILPKGCRGSFCVIL